MMLFKKTATMQALIFLLGVPAIILIGCESPELRHIGFWCGLLSQPFWLIESARKRQWGIFAMSIVYSGAMQRHLSGAECAYFELSRTSSSGSGL